MKIKEGAGSLGGVNDETGANKRARAGGGTVGMGETAAPQFL